MFNDKDFNRDRNSEAYRLIKPTDIKRGVDSDNEDGE